MSNYAGGKGGARGCEAQEVKYRVALVRVPFYFIIYSWSLTASVIGHIYTTRVCPPVCVIHTLSHYTHNSMMMSFICVYVYVSVCVCVCLCVCVYRWACRASIYIYIYIYIYICICIYIYARTTGSSLSLSLYIYTHTHERSLERFSFSGEVITPWIKKKSLSGEVTEHVCLCKATLNPKPVSCEFVFVKHTRSLAPGHLFQSLHHSSCLHLRRLCTCS